MLCPICNVDLIVSDRSGMRMIIVQSVVTIWLDRGELDKIIERSISNS
ncbi:TPA: hypothetical protein RTH10_000185 [Campylobacter jejuni]|nr:hypothetical protein [Campylobacter jejuni]